MPAAFDAMNECFLTRTYQGRRNRLSIVFGAGSIDASAGRSAGNHCAAKFSGAGVLAQLIGELAA